MGSLMAGWSSHAFDDDHKVRFMRNRSLTKEDVEAFWRQKRKPADQVGSAGEIVVVASPPLASFPHQDSPRSLRPSTLSHVRSSPPEIMTRTDADGGGEVAASPSASRDWWSRSSWAFLNEPLLLRQPLPPPPPQQQQRAGGQGNAAI